MSFNIGLSGLYAANKSLDVTGNNIANVATTGFKSSRVEFSDVYSASILGTGSKSAGNGVRVGAIAQQFTQGDINNTGNVLDMGVQGTGFFVLSDNGSLTYTRAGAFKKDRDDYIVDNDGNRLQGYGVDADGNIIKGVRTDLKIDTSNLSPEVTSKWSPTINLKSTDEIKTGTFSASDADSYNWADHATFYDAQGNGHQADIYYVKTGANTWDSYYLIDGRNPQDPTSDTPAKGSLSFSDTGKLVGITAGDGLTVKDNAFVLSGWVPAQSTTTTAADGTTTTTWASNGAAAAKDITINMNASTQYAVSSARTSGSPDGYATGQLSSLSIDENGVMFASFTNGESKAIGQVALASFSNEQGLQSVGGTKWKETYSSGQAAIDSPQTGTLGKIESSSLEESNVNLTNELVELIKAQSNYQANAKTISTQSTIMQTLIQMS